MLFENFILFALSSIILVQAASYSVKFISKIAEYLHFAPFIASFVIAGLISTFPELLIGINSALEGNPSLGFATIIGSNVIDLTLIIGLVALVGGTIEVK
ncbi:MAG: hypothetical protein Q7S21_04015, partial [archaeon]|nr:hypothetical protein [archaeon]